MKQYNMEYREAHEISEREHNYSKALEEFLNGVS